MLNLGVTSILLDAVHDAVVEEQDDDRLFGNRIDELEREMNE